MVGGGQQPVIPEILSQPAPLWREMADFEPIFAI